MIHYDSVMQPELGKTYLETRLTKDDFRVLMWALVWYIIGSSDYGSLETVEHYDVSAQKLTARRQLAEVVVSLIKDNCRLNKSDARILELAAGTGLVSESLLTLSGQKVFLDLSPFALRIASGRLKDSRSFLVQADSVFLPFALEVFNVVVDVGGLRYLTSNQFSEWILGVVRVLKTEGILVVAQFHPRISSMKGLDLEKMLNQLPPALTLRQISTLPVYMGFLGFGKIRVGEYKIFVFEKQKN